MITGLAIWAIRSVLRLKLFIAASKVFSARSSFLILLYSSSVNGTSIANVCNISVNLKAAYETEGKEIVKSFEKAILLHTIDDAWKENLRELDELKHSVQNASYEQKDPLLIFKLESVNLFDNMVHKINNNTISVLMRGQIPVQEPEQVREAAPEPQTPRQQYREEKQDLSDPHQQAAAERDTREVKREPVRAEKTVGRNDPCPCGSGKKYKNCHGQNA